jgi:hypothetical protein
MPPHELVPLITRLRIPGQSYSDFRKIYFILYNEALCLSVCLSVADCYRKIPFSRYIPSCTVLKKREQKSDRCFPKSARLTSFSFIATNFNRIINLFVAPRAVTNQYPLKNGFVVTIKLRSGGCQRLLEHLL